MFAGRRRQRETDRQTEDLSLVSRLQGADDRETDRQREDHSLISCLQGIGDRQTDKQRQREDHSLVSCLQGIDDTERDRQRNRQTDRPTNRDRERFIAGFMFAGHIRQHRNLIYFG